MSEFSEFDREDKPEKAKGESPEGTPREWDSVLFGLGAEIGSEHYIHLLPSGDLSPFQERIDENHPEGSRPAGHEREDDIYSHLELAELVPESSDEIPLRKRKPVTEQGTGGASSSNLSQSDVDRQEILENQRCAREAVQSGRAKHAIYSHGNRPFYAEFQDDAAFESFTRTLSKHVGAYHASDAPSSAREVQSPGIPLEPNVSTALAIRAESVSRAELTPEDWGILRAHERVGNHPEQAVKATVLRASLLADAGLASEKPLSMGNYREKWRNNEQFLKDAGREIAAALSLIERCPVLRTLVGESIDILSTERRKEFAIRLTDGHQVRDPADPSDTRRTVLRLNADYVERVTPAQLAGEICAWTVYFRGKTKDIFVFSPEVRQAKLGIAISVLEEFGDTPSDRADVERLERRQKRFAHGLDRAGAQESPIKVLSTQNPSPRLFEAALQICTGYHVREDRIQDSRFINRDEAEGAYSQQALLSGTVKEESGLEIDSFDEAVRDLIRVQRERLLKELAASGQRVFQEYPRLMDELLSGHNVRVEWSLEHSRNEAQLPLVGKFRSAGTGAILVEEGGLVRAQDVMRVVVEDGTGLCFWVHGSAPDYDPRGPRELWGLGLV